MRIKEGFQQVPFTEENPYTSDSVLPPLLRRTLPPSVFREIEPDLERLGSDVLTIVRAMGSGNRVAPPRLTKYDQWGRRIDELETSQGWQDLKAFSQKEGIPGIFYERRYKEHSRTYGFAKIVMMVGDSYEVFCPLSMTDGSARVIELLGSKEMKEKVFPRLISRDPAVCRLYLWTIDDRATKSSCTVSRTRSAHTPSLPQNSPSNAPKHTSSATSTKVSKNISSSLNITRLWSATGSVGALRKCLSIATAYAKVRTIDGGTRLLQDAPLHVSQLAGINLLYRALMHLTFGVIKLMGKSECDVADKWELKRLRMLTPTVKAFAAEKASAGMEDAMSALGGAGYMEENGFGRAIRDSLVEKYADLLMCIQYLTRVILVRIWEGTTTVLALDLARVAQDPATTEAFISWAQGVVSSCPSDLRKQLQEPLDILHGALEELGASLQKPIAPLVQRPAIMLTGYVASAVFLLEHAIWAHVSGESSRETDIDVVGRWIVEGGMIAIVEDVKRAKGDGDKRTKSDLAVVFGRGERSKL